MRPERFEAIDELLGWALELPPDERQAFLERECQDRPETRAHLERLLAADQAAANLLEGPWRALTLVEPDVEPGAPFGPYRVEREIGRGGMGTVFLGSRDDGEYERRVAIKLLGQGRFRPGSLARFKIERECLASLEHPGIARLYDSGRTRRGEPFLVMEYVDGEPIDAYCDHRRLAIEDRLKLFLKVLEAVAFAHRNLLVHRDLKPANILVSAAGEPKLIDFGIAKLLSAERVTHHGETAAGARLLTPSYASPEQIRGEPVTTATDIYSLGVVLCELLCGERPYRLTSDLPYELERAVLEQEPLGPSQALASRSREIVEERARSRSTSHRLLIGRLEGDLDTLVKKALAKEPHQRFGTAAELAADLERHLGGLPIAARPARFSYRAAKFVRRHRWAVSATASLAVVALAFLVTAIRDRWRANLERDRARQALEFLVESFGELNPYQRTGGATTALAVVEAGTKRLEEAEAGDPQVKAALFEALGGIFESFRQLDRAAGLLEQAVELRRATAGPQSLEFAEALERLARVRLNQGNYAASEALLEDVVARKRRLLGSGNAGLARALFALATAKDQRRTEETRSEADLLLEEAVDSCRGCAGKDRAIAGRALISRARIALERGAAAEAEALYRDGLDRSEQALGPQDPEVLLDRGGFALILLQQGKAAEAERMVRSALAGLRPILGEEHADLGELDSNLGMALLHQGKSGEAEQSFRAAMLTYAKVLGSDHPFVGLIQGNVVNALIYQDRWREALPLAIEALAARRKSYGATHPLVAQSLLSVAAIERALGQLTEAGQHAREALEIQRGSLPPDSPQLALSLAEQGRVLLAVGNAVAAEPLLRQAVELRQKHHPPEHFERLRAELALGECLLAQGRVQEAAALLNPAATLLKQLHLPESTVRRQAERAQEALRRHGGQAVPE